MIQHFLSSIANCFRIQELRSRIIYTLLILGVCRLVAMIPIPGLDGAALSAYFEKNSGGAAGGLLSMYSMFTGGALMRCAVGSLGIMPYITATIILQLLTGVIPQLSKMAREEGGRSKIVQIGRFMTVLICLGHGFLMTLGWEKPSSVLGSDFTDRLVLSDNLWLYRFQTVAILTTGTMLLMWLGEQITERGIGNGVSLVITIGIMAELPSAVQTLWVLISNPAAAAQAGVDSGMNFTQLFILLALLVLVTAAVVATTQAQRKIPIQHTQRSVGRKVFAGGTSFLPIRFLHVGVMPIIFAQAVLMIPSMLFKMIGDRFELDVFSELARYMDPYNPTWVYVVVYGLFILVLSYIWTATQFNELQIADDLKRSGGYIPGVRPGQETSRFLHATMNRITLAGALFLVVIALFPNFLNSAMGIPPIVGSFLGGTSILITVGVLLDTMRQVETHLMMRHYDGFLKGGKMKGRI